MPASTFKVIPGDVMPAELRDRYFIAPEELSKQNTNLISDITDRMSDEGTADDDFDATEFSGEDDEEDCAAQAAASDEMMADKGDSEVPRAVH